MRDEKRKNTKPARFLFPRLVLAASLLLFPFAEIPVAEARTATEQTQANETLPPQASAEWYYERALAQYLFGHERDAETDLRESLRKRPNSAESYYLLAALMERNHHRVEAIKALRMVLQLSKIEHVPARLRLIALHQQLEQPYEAVPHVEALLKHLQIGGPEIADGRITLQMLLTDPESKPARVFAAVEQLTAAVKIYLFDVPARFQAATLDRRLADVLVGLEFVESLKRQENTSDADLTAVLGRLCAMRGGFSPSVLTQIGNLEEKQTRLPQAVAALKRAFRQFVWLRFSEAGGDYSSVRITELEKRMAKSAEKSK